MEINLMNKWIALTVWLGVWAFALGVFGFGCYAGYKNLVHIGVF